MERYKVTGMSCAACSQRVERAVSQVDGVTECSVNLLTNSMIVEGSATSEEIIGAVDKAGYGASILGEEKTTYRGDTLEDKETPRLLKRLIMSMGFLIVLMYFSMGHMMWGFPLPSFFENNYIAVGIVQLLLTIAVMIINGKFFVSGFKALKNKAPNMDTLVALGSGAAFVYSVYALFAMTGYVSTGDMTAAMEWSHEFYFESAAMILALITVGKMLEAFSKGKTTNAIKGLMELSPKTAVVLRDGKEEEIEISKLKEGDTFIVKPGAGIPVDGTIISGHGAIDESALTGESIPIDKSEGDEVYSATINKSGYMVCRADKVGEDTTLSQIIKMVSDASSTKAPIAKVADKVSGVFVPAVITIAVVTIIVWLIVGKSVGFSLARGISVLVISCPCALGLATPVAIMVGSGKGARNGILFKTAASLETVGKTEIIALDKTGTITKGEPEVTDIISASGITEDELLSYAYAIEIRSEHPLSRAIVSRADAIKLKEVEDFINLPGKGLQAKLDGKEIAGGNFKFISSVCDIEKEIEERAVKLSDEGKTPLFFSYDHKLLGIIAVSDVIKDDSTEAISELKKMGIKVIMLTGDNERTANAIGKIAGVDKVIAGVMPDGKASVIRRLRDDGNVAMVGDGINDAPSLVSADTGIAIGQGTDIAIDAADIVLIKSGLKGVSAAIRLGRQVLKNIYENLFWAFIYNAIGIPLAAGVFINLFGWKLNPMFGAAAMSLSSFCVVTNALRLNLFNVHSSKRDRKIKTKKGKKSTMEFVLKIEGMMCSHCEARVKKCLEETNGVTEAIVSHEKDEAIVKCDNTVSYDTLKKVIEDAGYKVLN